MAEISSYVVAKYDYESKDEQELTIKKGERLALLDDSRNWWRVRNDRCEDGFVPSNYIRAENWKDTVRGTLRKLPDLPRKNSHPSTTTASAKMSRPALTAATFSCSLNQSNGRSNGEKSKTAMKILCKALVRYDYPPKREDELSLTKGQFVAVVEKSSDGWWKGCVILQKNDQEETLSLENLQSRQPLVFGWFPSNYVLSMDDPASHLVLAACSSATSSPFKTAPLVTSSPCHNLNNNSGLKKVNGSSSSSSSNNNASGELVVATYSFSGQHPGDLSFDKGDRLLLLPLDGGDDELYNVGHASCSNEWRRAKNESGQIGLIPLTYVEPIKTTVAIEPIDNNLQRLPSPGTLRNRSVREGACQKFKVEPWYYGQVSRDDSDKVLQQFGDNGDFLIRDSESNPGDFSISLKASLKNKHFWVRCDDQGMYNIGNRKFDSMPALIEHYSNHPIFSNDKGERLFLIKPLIS